MDVTQEKYSQILATVAAGQTDQTSSILNMANYDEIVIGLHMGAIVSGSVVTALIQEGDQSDLSDAATVSGSSVTIADTADGKMWVWRIPRRKKQYFRLKVTRATQDATIAAAWAIQRKGRLSPETDDTSVVAKTIVASA